MSVKIMDIEMTNDDYMMVMEKIGENFGTIWNHLSNTKRKGLINQWLNNY